LLYVVKESIELLGTPLHIVKSPAVLFYSQATLKKTTVPDTTVIHELDGFSSTRLVSLPLLFQADTPVQLASSRRYPDAPKSSRQATALPCRC